MKISAGIILLGSVNFLFMSLLIALASFTQSVDAYVLTSFILVGFPFVFSLIGILTAIGLFLRKGWARKLACILAWFLILGGLLYLLLFISALYLGQGPLISNIILIIMDIIEICSSRVVFFL